jgi:hypothetical protein
MKIWGFFGLVWFPCFTKKSIIHFVLQISQSGHSFLSTVKPALSYLEAGMDRSTAFTPDADLILTGAKRQAHAKAGPAKKAQLLRQEDLTRVILSVFPGDDSTGCSSPTEMRTAFRSLIEYHTLCKFACFDKLQAKHFELIGQDIMVTFPTAKNDQLHREPLDPGSGMGFFGIPDPVSRIPDPKTF